MGWSGDGLCCATAGVPASPKATLAAARICLIIVLSFLVIAISTPTIVPEGCSRRPGSRASAVVEASIATADSRGPTAGDISLVNVAASLALERRLARMHDILEGGEALPVGLGRLMAGPRRVDRGLLQLHG